MKLIGCDSAYYSVMFKLKDMMVLGAIVFYTFDSIAERGVVNFISQLKWSIAGEWTCFIISSAKLNE